MAEGLAVVMKRQTPDRLILSSALLLKEVSLYATPMDLVIRVLVIPQAINRVMLPAFTSSKTSQDVSYKLFRFSFFILLITCFPLLWLLAGFSPLILRLWLNPEMGTTLTLEQAANQFKFIYTLGIGIASAGVIWLLLFKPEDRQKTKQFILGFLGKK